MSYTKTNWVNDTEPAINADNLNKMEQGIKDANDMLDGTQVTGDMIVESIRTKNMLDTGKAYVTSGSVTILDSAKGTLDIQCTSGYYSRVSVRVAVIPDETYTLSYTATISTGTSSPTVVVRKLDDSTNIVQTDGEGDKTLTFSTTEDGVIISFFATMGVNTGRIVYENIQLENGDTATEYSDYQPLNGYDIVTHAINGLMSSVDKGSLDSIFGVPVDTVSNLDNVYEGSFKFDVNTTNAPTTGSGKILAFKLSNDNYRYQIVITDYNLPIYARYRYYYQQWRWSSWYKIDAELLSGSITYSTSEQKIGTWTDGKTLYRKVVPFTISTGWDSFGSFSNVDKFIKITGVRASAGNVYPFYAGASSYGYFYIPSSKSSIFIATAGEVSAQGYLIVEYTKT